MTRRRWLVGALAAGSAVALRTVVTVTRSRGQLSGFRSPEAERRYLQAYEESLSHWPVAYEALTVETPFGDTHVLVSGDDQAPPLVLLHATGTSATGWGMNIEALSQRHRVFAVDIIGEAGRSKQTRLLRDRQDCVQWLTSVLDELGLPSPQLCGWSFGGWLALAFTVDQPQHAAKTALLAPYASLAPYAPAVLLFLKIGPYLPMGPPGRLALRMMAPHYRFDDSFAEQFVLGGRTFKAADPRTSVFPQPFSDDELRSITTPVLLLVGDRESTFDPVRAVTRARRSIPQVEAELLPGIGHMIAMEASDVVNPALLRFLNR